MTQRFGMTITAFGLSVDEVQSFLLVAIVGFLAGILPAWQAYRTNVAANLIRTN
jgi:ABC-type antimicrobial peptide transport system permease subunit